MKFSTLKDLLDQRALKVEEADALIDVAQSEGRDLTDEEAAKFDQLHEEISQLDARIGRQQKIEAFKGSRTAPVGNGQDELSEQDKKDLRKFNLGKALAKLAEGRQLEGIELEVAKMGEESARSAGIVPIQGSLVVPSSVLKRGQTVTGQTAATGDQGGVTVPEDLNPLIDALWSKTWLGPAGARFLTGLQGNQRFPIQTTKPTITQLTEIQEDSLTEILFSDFQMTPKRRGATIPFSRQMMIQSSLDIQSLVIENISLALSQYLNTEALGVVLAAITAGNNNIVELGTNGDVPSYETLVKIRTKVDTKDALIKAPVWVTNPLVQGQLQLTQKFTGTNGQPVWGDTNELLGYNAVVTNLVPSNLVKGSATNCSALVFGNFDDLYVGIWDGFEFVVDPYTQKRKGQIEVTANTFYDVKVARADSFAGAKDVLTSLVS